MLVSKLTWPEIFILVSDPLLLKLPYTDEIMRQTKTQVSLVVVSKIHMGLMSSSIMKTNNACIIFMGKYLENQSFEVTAGNQIKVTQ